MSKDDINIITMKIKYHTETKEDSDRIFQMIVNYNNIVKCTYNYLLKHPKSKTAEISKYQMRNSKTNWKVEMWEILTGKLCSRKPTFQNEVCGHSVELLPNTQLPFFFSHIIVN